MWLAFVRLGFLPWALRATIFVLLILTAPVLLYHVLEAPLIRFGVNLSERIASSPETTQASSVR